jgi:hypothetical protein
MTHPILSTTSPEMLDVIEAEKTHSLDAPNKECLHFPSPTPEATSCAQDAHAVRSCFDVHLLYQTNLLLS